VFPNLDATRLKGSFDYFVKHYASAELIAPGHSAIVVAIADFVEGTHDFCCERVAEIDRDLQKRDAYTLYFLHDYFTRRGNKI